MQAQRSVQHTSTQPRNEAVTGGSGCDADRASHLPYLVMTMTPRRVRRNRQHKNVAARALMMLLMMVAVVLVVVIGVAGIVGVMALPPAAIAVSITPPPP